MFQDDFYRLKQLKEKLATQYDVEEKTLNQTISIRDIFIYGGNPATSFGEAKVHDNKYNSQPSFARLVDHVDMLATVGTLYHQKYNCHQEPDGTYTIKEECLNKITRILLNEFSLNLAQPMSPREFSLFLDVVYAIAKNQQENVHLLLSSTSLLLYNNTLLNISLYVQCGSEPKIEVFCKGSFSAIDLIFANTTPFNPSPAKISEYVLSAQGVIPTNSVFTIRTAGGAEYTQAIDVCLDHELRRSRALMTDMIETPVATHTSMIPNQVDQVVTSNSIELINMAKLAEPVVHIDTVYKTAKHMNNDIMTIAELNEAKKNKYGPMTILQSANGFSIKNPAFGSDYEIVVTEERELSSFLAEFKQTVTDRNDNLKKYLIATRLEQVKDGKAYNEIIHEQDKVVEKINDLQVELNIECEMTSLEAFFHAGNYEFKFTAGTIINQSFAALKKTIASDSADFMDIVTVHLTNLKDALQRIGDGTPNDLQSRLISKVTEVIESTKSVQLTPRCLAK